MADKKYLAYVISVGDWQELYEKFPMFAPAKLSTLAKLQGAFEDKHTKTGWGVTRNKADDGWVVYVGFNGGLISYCPSCDNGGLRIGLRLKYDKDSEVTKSLYIAKQKELVWDRKTQKKILMSGKAPVVTFGKNEYIWMNMEECQNQGEDLMKLVSLEYLERAEKFGEKQGDDEYVDATALLNQVERVATANCTQAERDLIVPVILSNEDNYMSEIPVFENSKGDSEVKKAEVVALNQFAKAEGKA